MSEFCVRDLAELIGGRLRFGSMPPLAGDLELVDRIVTDWQLVQQGDVFWGLDAPTYEGSRFAEPAFMRGALGAVVSGRGIEPWAGKFAIEVDDANRALTRLIEATGRRMVGDRLSLSEDVPAQPERIIQAKISEALPFVSVLREIDAPFPPG